MSDLIYYTNTIHINIQIQYKQDTKYFHLFSDLQKEHRRNVIHQERF